MTKELKPEGGWHLWAGDPEQLAAFSGHVSLSSDAQGLAVYPLGSLST